MNSRSIVLSTFAVGSVLAILVARTPLRAQGCSPATPNGISCTTPSTTVNSVSTTNTGSAGQLLLDGASSGSVMLTTSPGFSGNSLTVYLDQLAAGTLTNPTGGAVDIGTGSANSYIFSNSIGIGNSWGPTVPGMYINYADGGTGTTTFQGIRNGEVWNWEHLFNGLPIMQMQLGGGYPFASTLTMYDGSQPGNPSTSIDGVGRATVPGHLQTGSASGSTDLAGTITVAANTNSNSHSFLSGTTSPTPYTTPPVCVANDTTQNMANPVNVSVTNTAPFVLTVYLAQTFAVAHVINYICVGRT